MNYPNGQGLAASPTQILESLRSQWHETKERVKKRVPRFEITESEFMAELRAHGCIAIASSGGEHSFEYDDKVSKVARQLWYYTVGDERFDGSLQKGIALIGYYGCGKSLIMEAYSRLVNYRIHLMGKRIPHYEFITSQSLFQKVKDDGLAPYVVGNLIIDELGREAKVAKIWGNESLPVVDVLFERHRKGHLTHMTANFDLRALSDEDMYGEMLGDRFREMFNFIVMDGGSRRK